MTIFKECKRVLKPDGTLWVNINDCFINGVYQLTEAHLKIAMQNDGWFLHDELIWSKNNPTPVKSDRSQRNHEYFLVFKKSRDVYYTREWMENCDEEISSIVYGLKGKKVNRKIKSSFTLNGSIFTTNVANTGGLRKLCEEMGMDHMHHTATFPWLLPYIAIQCSTKVGDIVLDCFNGTASTGLVAVHTGRKYVGYELNTTFIEASIVQMTSSKLEPLAA
jgi:DNA modification methylase